MDTDDLMAEIYQAFNIPDLKDGEFTVGMYAERAGISVVKAHSQIRQAIAAGKIEEAGERYVNGRARMAYKRKG
jgi:hypothetical protein